MIEETEDFFGGKKPWSVIKDNVLKQYMPPYLNKVNKLGNPILLIDAYAGPGEFDDGEPGSPLILCSAAEKNAKGNYQAFFFNKEEKYHKKLQENIAMGGWSHAAYPQLGDSQKFLQVVPNIVYHQTIFLYLDPFGLGSEFSLLEPFLQRSTKYSTEILQTMCMPVVHRLAGSKDQVEEGRIKSYRDRLTKVFGGDYWRDILWDSGLAPEGKLKKLINTYVLKLREYLPFAGACPVKEKSESRTKYFIVFASRHQDALVLLNGIMMDAYNTHMHDAAYQGSLFGELSWRDTIEIGGAPDRKLDSLILETVAKYPGKTRKDIWPHIVLDHFMQYHESDYKKVVRELVDTNRLNCPTPRKTKLLNDNCVLYLP